MTMPEPQRTAVAEPDAARSGVADDLVSVLIPARNEEAFIGACLDSVLAQDASNLQVLVVDGGSDDRTVEVVREYSARDGRVELLSLPPGPIPTSLNAGLAAARGRWLVRVDAHSTVPADYVRRAIAHLSTGRFGGVGGRKDAVASSPSGRAVAAVLGSRFGVGNSVYHYGARPRTVDHVPFGCYPTNLLREMGGWDERLAANEDYELDYRLRRGGHRLLFDPELRIAWRSRETVPDLFRQYRRYGRGKAAVARLHPSSLQPRHLAAPALVAGGAAFPLIAAYRPLIAGLAALPYAVGLTAASVVTARKVDGLAARLRVPAAFVAMHAGWGIGFWEGLARGARGGPS